MPSSGPKNGMETMQRSPIPVQTLQVLRGSPEESVAADGQGEIRGKPVWSSNFSLSGYAEDNLKVELRINPPTGIQRRAKTGRSWTVASGAVSARALGFFLL